MSEKKVVPLFRVSLQIESIHATAWTMCSGLTRQKLLKIGAHQPSDLYMVRTCRFTESFVFRGQTMDMDAMEAYLEFREKVIQEGVRRKTAQLSKEIPVSGVD